MESSDLEHPLIANVSRNPLKGLKNNIIGLVVKVIMILEIAEMQPAVYYNQIANNFYQQ